MLISSQTGGANGIRTEYTYDLAGNILTQRVGDAVTTFAYDNRGRLIRTTDALGQTETFTYDNNGLLLTRTDRNSTEFSKTYDHMGRLIREDAFRLVGRRHYLCSYRTYAFTQTGALRSLTSRTVHNESGEILDTHAITYYYNAQGQLSRRTETDGVSQRFVYNAAGNLEFTEIRIDGIVRARRSYTFDIAQRVSTVTTRDTLISSYTYDANGNITGRIRENGLRTYYTRNLAGMVISMTNMHGDRILSSFEYSYYLDGNIRQILENMDGMTRTITYTYDLARRLVREEEADSISSWERLRTAINNSPVNTPFVIPISGSFDAQSHGEIIIPANRRIILTGPDGAMGTLVQRNDNQRHFVVYGSLTLGQNITLCGGADNTDISGGVFVKPGGTFTMADGSVIQNCITLSGGAVFLEGSGTGESTRATFNISGGIIRNNSMIYNSGAGVFLWGNSRMNRSGGVITNDVAGNTAGNVLTLPAGTDFSPYLGTSVHSLNRQVRDYYFDNRGNRTMMRATGEEDYTVTYTYDLNNRLLSSTRTPANGSPEVSTYTYDHNGNQLNRTTGNQTETRIYSVFNQLIIVTRPGMTAIYTYRADGLRHSKTVNGRITTHVWNGSNIILERNDQGIVINRFDRGQRGRLVVSRHHGWYIHNVRGDVVQRVDANGNILRTYRYSAFGVERDPNSHNTNPFRFAGEYYDWERGEYYLRARSFNPRTGRFTQPDPFWNNRNMTRNRYTRMQAANLFVFTMNNPVRWIDPSGMVAIPGLSGGMQIAPGHWQSSIGIIASQPVNPKIPIKGNWPTNNSSGGGSSSSGGSSGGSSAGSEITLTSSAYVRYNPVTGRRETVYSGLIAHFPGGSTVAMESSSVTSTGMSFLPYTHQFLAKNDAILAWGLTFHPRTTHAVTWYSWIYRNMNTGVYMFGTAGDANLLSRQRQEMGLVEVGWIHTHPITGFEHDLLREQFSGVYYVGGVRTGDGTFTNQIGVPGFLVTPRGMVKRLDPSWAGNTRWIDSRSPYVTTIISNIFNR